MAQFITKQADSLLRNDSNSNDDRTSSKINNISIKNDPILERSATHDYSNSSSIGGPLREAVWPVAPPPSSISSSATTPLKQQQQHASSPVSFTDVIAFNDATSPHKPTKSVNTQHKADELSLSSFDYYFVRTCKKKTPIVDDYDDTFFESNRSPRDRLHESGEGKKKENDEREEEEMEDGEEDEEEDEIEEENNKSKVLFPGYVPVVFKVGFYYIFVDSIK